MTSPLQAHFSPRHHSTVADEIADRVGSGQLSPADQVLVSVRDLLDVERKLASQPVIDQAKGVLMGYYAIDADTAFAVLTRWSQNHNVKLRELAAALMDGVTDHNNKALSPQDIVDHAVAAHCHRHSHIGIDDERR